MRQRLAAFLTGTAAGHGFKSIKGNFSIQTNPKTGKPCAVDLQLLERIISPRREDSEQHLAHMELAETTFMRRAK
jgi:hypothetical protein